MDDALERAMQMVRDEVGAIRDPDTRKPLMIALTRIFAAARDGERWARRVKLLERRVSHAAFVLGYAPQRSVEVACCTVCGGADVSCLVWARPNEGLVEELATDDPRRAVGETGWCDACAKTVTLRWGA